MDSTDVKIALENNFRVNKSPLLKMAIDCITDLENKIEKEILSNINKENKMKSECECKITDLLKDYTILHERISTLYKILEINRCIQWYWVDSSRTKKKLHYKGLLYGVSLNVKKLGLIKCTEDMDNVSVKNNFIREVKNEIKRYHRLQSNIQNVLNSFIEMGEAKLYRKYNTEEVPSQFKSKMNYNYYTQY